MKQKNQIEEQWDRKASEFYQNQKQEDSGLPSQVISLLEHRGILPCNSVLDIGGGSGRYAVKLSPFAMNVVQTDISSEMLRYGTEYAEQQNCSNIDFQKIDWLEIALSDVNWDEKFDLAFSCMCPATQLLEGWRKMEDATRKWCCLVQYVVRQDTIEKYLVEQYDLRLPPDIHNNRTIVGDLWKDTWSRNLLPEVHYVTDVQQATFTMEEALSIYQDPFASLLQKKGSSLEQALSKLVSNATISVSGTTVLAVVLWQPKR